MSQRTDRVEQAKRDRTNEIHKLVDELRWIEAQPKSELLAQRYRQRIERLIHRNNTGVTDARFVNQPEGHNPRVWPSGGW